MFTFRTPGGEFFHSAGDMGVQLPKIHVASGGQGTQNKYDLGRNSLIHLAMPKSGSVQAYQTRSNEHFKGGRLGSC